MLEANLRQEASMGKMDGSTPSVHAEKQSSTTSIVPIAVIGMAFRGPGDATSPQKLWNMCCEGRNAWTEFPKDRINAEGFWHPDATRPGCVRFQYRFLLASRLIFASSIAEGVIS